MLSLCVLQSETNVFGYTGSKDAEWSKAAVTKLIELCHEHDEQLTDKKTRKKGVWASISGHLASANLITVSTS